MEVERSRSVHATSDNGWREGHGWMNGESQAQDLGEIIPEDARMEYANPLRPLRDSHQESHTTEPSE
jgi:hypothetical protein